MGIDNAIELKLLIADEEVRARLSWSVEIHAAGLSQIEFVLC